MIELDFDELRTWFGFGVAGNFAGHLEQAGEAADFVNVSSDGVAPKGIFPWYAPGYDGFLGEFPLSHDAIALPESDSPLNLQIEPEVGPGVPGDLAGRHRGDAAALRAGRVQRLLDQAAQRAEDQPQEELGSGVEGRGRRSSSTSTT